MKVVTCKRGDGMSAVAARLTSEYILMCDYEHIYGALASRLGEQYTTFCSFTYIK